MGRPRRGCVLFSTGSIRVKTTGWRSRSYVAEVEVFLIHCHDTERIYAVPVDEAPASHCSLRVEPTQNGQEAAIRWASDHELPA